MSQNDVEDALRENAELRVMIAEALSDLRKESQKASELVHNVNFEFKKIVTGDPLPPSQLGKNPSKILASFSPSVKVSH
jgi:hypothetical protein